MKELVVSLKLGKGKIDIGVLDIYDAELKYHASGHPVVSLLPSTRWRNQDEAQHVFRTDLPRERRYTIEDMYDDCWTEDVFHASVKKGVQKRLCQMTELVLENKEEHAFI